MVKLTPQDYAEILTRLRKGETPQQILDSLPPEKKVSIKTIYKIKQGKLRPYLHYSHPHQRRK